jgi:3-methyladenine DNA glycosylase AlkD
MQKLQELKRQMRALGSPAKAAAAARFFKTGPGQYAQGDVFLGLTLPRQRAFAKEFAHLSQADLQALLDAPEHEFRLTALIILVAQYQRADPKTQKTLHHFYIQNTSRINNWDLVDSSAPDLVGHHVHTTGTPALLDKLALSPLLWERRIAMVATLYEIKLGESQNALRIAQTLLSDKHDLMHKAVGWMLREVGKRASLSDLVAFLDQHHKTMPRTALRYALEHFDPKDRQHYMKR